MDKYGSTGQVRATSLVPGVPDPTPPATFGSASRNLCKVRLLEALKTDVASVRPVKFQNAPQSEHESSPPFRWEITWSYSVPTVVNQITPGHENPDRLTLIGVATAGPYGSDVQPCGRFKPRANHAQLPTRCSQMAQDQCPTATEPTALPRDRHPPGHPCSMEPPCGRRSYPTQATAGRSGAVPRAAR